jgi:hypothetical protein
MKNKVKAFATRASAPEATGMMRSMAAISDAQ